ncbi:MAG: UDP-N-acetylglucosamine--N-acetylmuramyl-(pentapeptide) pyrophosphoryl-undecaprenol N-acetylglucosamine transferase [Candidatus Aegiribacteria sp.]|nr:UDP-N-acetylglucosamine--N-acetylmuramyl-(pentapeptide) pyrophosphoryl-undecaprenol N-acetylglucosamine transferase [Candidatus Aegiribacteria sp.]
MKVVIAGGGTGGHISPAIAVAEAIWEKKPDTVIDFIATPRPVDQRMYSKIGSTVHILNPPRIDRGISDIVLLPFRAVREFIRARKLLQELDASVLFATGGYPCFFPVAAARSLGIPSIIHESNSIPGRANRLASRFADKVLTGFYSSASGFRKTTVYTGNPVRLSLRRYDREFAREKLNIPDGVPVVLFLGGSQGARAINDIALKVPEGIQVLLQCGSRDKERTKSESPCLQRIQVIDFTDDPALLYSAADIAVARSGAMTVAELTWFRIPAVYIPYPFAADNHQEWNAREIADKHGALLVLQDSADADVLWEIVDHLLEDTDEIRRMKNCLEETMHDNPAGIIAEIVMNTALKGS